MTAATPIRLTVGALIVALLLFAAALWPASVRADVLIEAEPAPGETIGEEPEVILLRFDRDLELTRDVNTVAVFDAAGERVDDGQAEIAGYSPRTMVVHLAAAVEEGDVTVRYRVRFADSGETVDGEFDFAIEPGVVEDAEVAAVGEPRSQQSIVLWTVAIMVAIALFALMLYYLRVATDNAQSSVQEADDSHH